MEVGQKVLFASQESQSGLQYDPGFVQNMFLHTVLTGLQSGNIECGLQPYLELPKISDELLLEKLNTSCAFEGERQDKRKMLQPWIGEDLPWVKTTVAVQLSSQYFTNEQHQLQALYRKWPHQLNSPVSQNKTMG